MIILDNIIFSIQKTGGVSVVWEELLNRLLSQSKYNIQCIEYDVRNNINRSRIQIPLDIISKNKKYFPFYRYLPVRIAEHEKFIFHSSYYRYCKNRNAINITTVHDFIYEYYFKGIRKNVHFLQKKYAIQNSDYIIAISENTKKDILTFFPNIDEKRIRVVYNGVSDDYFCLLKEMTVPSLPFDKYSYILFVGSRVSYKNFDLVVKAVARSKYNLVIVGAPLTNCEKRLLSENFNDTTRCKYVGYTSNYNLNILYNYAFSLIYPSSYEGFGIPVIEAQKAGCPVIAANLSSIPEIIGSTPLLLNDLSIDCILDCLHILEDNVVRSNIINCGLYNSKQYSWDKMFEQVTDIYDEALSF